MPGDRIIFGAAALPEPERTWLAAVERLPIESVWQGGHVLAGRPGGEAVTRLALLTAWTERVRVGTAILLLPLYHPVIVAKQLADLDAWSGGRVSVGVGVGGEFRPEFDAVGVALDERGARTDEAMEVMRALWTGDPVTHHGRFFDLDEAQLRPVEPPGPGIRAEPPGPGIRAEPPGPDIRAEPPGPDIRAEPPGPGIRAMQVGGPPLLVSGRKPPAMRRAARRGDGWMPYLMSPSAYADSVRTIRADAEANGRDLDGFEWMLYLYCSVRRDGDQARNDVATFLGRAYGDKPSSMLERIAPSGTPEQVAARLQEYVDAGVRHFIISPAAPEDTLEVITLAAEEVLPRLALPAPAR